MLMFLVRMGKKSNDLLHLLPKQGVKKLRDVANGASTVSDNKNKLKPVSKPIKKFVWQLGWL